MGQDNGRDDERPLHRVRLDPFRIARYQVTNGEYDVFWRATSGSAPPYRREPGFDDPCHPVVAVSWFEAVAYCQWLAASSGIPVRLPTEAEWELAARGGIESAMYPWGDAPLAERASYADRWKHGPEPVGTAEPNGFGLYDMCENVHEWCSDWYDARYYDVSAPTNPNGPETGSRRASRGGSWRHHIKVSRCAARSSIPPEFQYADYGFRIASDAG
jgi:formylglycine-generating enzyme